MNKYLFSAILTIGIYISGCTEQELPANIQDAEMQGRADARALCQANYSADKDIHAALLAVKAREFEMRQNGDSIGAAAYIGAFKKQLKESNNNLADKVL